MTTKRFYYKIYNGNSYWDQAYWDTSHWDNNPTQTWEGDIISEPKFKTVINGGAGQCIIKLMRPIDNFGENVDVALNLQVDLFVTDNEATNGALLYRGIIVGYSPIIDKGKEYIEVTLESLVNELSWYMLKDTSGNTALSYNSKDPSAIFQDIVDKYTTQGGKINYSSSSIQTTGTTVSYTFNLNTIKEALDQCIVMCPQKWYYYVDSQGVIHLSGPSNTVNHTFLIGKNITYMNANKSLTDVKNEVYFVGGTPAGQTQILNRYTRSSSISSYGNKTIKMQDQRVTLSATADNIVGSYLDYYQSPLVVTEVIIADSNGQDQGKGYDIESIQPGQLMQVKNLKGQTKTETTWDTATWDSSNWDYVASFVTADILQIQTVDYTPDSVTIQAAVAVPYIQNRIEDINRNLQNYTQATIPVAPNGGNSQ